MIDDQSVAGGGTGGTVVAVRALTARLAVTALDGVDTAALVDLIGELEAVKNAATAAQAAATRSLYAATVVHHERLGIPRARRGRGVAGQVGLARRVSPHRATTLLGLARAAVDLPHAHDLWRRGRITEHRMQTLLARVSHLDSEDRRGVDVDLAGTPAAAEALVRMGEGEALDAVDAHAHARDKAGVVRRRQAAEADRHVTSRRAPDQMLKVSALLPVKDGVSVIAALRQAAEQARCASGDDRTRGQVEADTLVARVTGRDPLTSPTPVHVDITMPLDVLTDTRTDGPRARARAGAGGWVDGYGHVSADLARSLAADAVESGSTWRRLFADPTTGQLVAMESTSRAFPAGLALYLRRRDRYCRTSWCNAPIRHSDHITPAAEGGPTSAENGQGLCEACNHTKQAPGWTTKTRTDPDGTHVVETTTPTGHTYDSRPPPAD